ncbi:MAG: hypothetical protein AAGB06_01735 [Verrucomicrobiota bacterium]
MRHNSIPNPEVFGLQLGAGQEFYGRVRAVNSISLQSYVTAAYSVKEVVIDMANSPLQVRIYSTDILDVASTAGDAADSVTQDIPFASDSISFGEQQFGAAVEPLTDRAETVIDMVPVVKDYPLTTHSKTIEFKLPSAEDVAAFFEKFNELWLQKPEAIDSMQSSDAETLATGRINPLSRVTFVYTQ